jgi:hypothetical protein
MKIIQESKYVTISEPETPEEYAGGELGHLMNKMPLGRYVPAIGYYKLVEVKNSPIHIDREIKQPVYAYFNSECPDNFLEEKVLIEAKFLYNKMSVGDKSMSLKAGMIIQVKETSLVESYYDGKAYQTYKVVWNIYN